MKTLRLVAIIVALTALPVQGQLEFSGGMNLSQLSGALGGSDLQNTGNRAGMVFGLDVIVPICGFRGAGSGTLGRSALVASRGSPRMIVHGRRKPARPAPHRTSNHIATAPRACPQPSGPTLGSDRLRGVSRGWAVRILSKPDRRAAVLASVSARRDPRRIHVR